MARELVIIAALVLVCWLLGWLILRDPRANLSGRGLSAAAGIIGTTLVSTGVWLCLLLAYLVGSR